MGRDGVRFVEMDWVDPIRVFRAAAGIPGCVWLDSGGEVGRASRWSAILARPVETIEARVGEGTGRRGRGSDPFGRLAHLHASWALRAGAGADGSGAGRAPDSPVVSGARSWEDAIAAGAVCSSGGMPERPPVTGGVVALLGYDLGRCLERLPALAADDPRLPDLWAAVYDGAILFDRLEKRVLATSWGIAGRRSLDDAAGLVREAGRGPEPAPAPRRRAGGEAPVRWAAGETQGLSGHRAAHDHHRVGGRDGGDGSVGRERAPGRDGEDGRESFLAGVARIREEIARGEIYQANLTRRVVRPIGGASARGIYESLRALSPTPFGAFVDAGRFQVLSASPERFVRIAGGEVETRPIKGTRRRGRTEDEDAALRDELLASGKDAAELLMIVDLERNDLGRVSRTGSVKVDPFPEIERYSTVSHLVATVRGSLRSDAGAMEVMRAMFPGGSITGAPKIRAMEILEGLEPCRRKFAMGSLLAWDFAGSLDSSILIRTLVVRAGEAVAHVGAGIVADSVPEEEYLETVAKAAPLMAALEESA